MGPTNEEDESKRRAIELIESLSKIIGEVSNFPEGRGPFRRSCCDLARRLKLLSPLFDEIHDGSIEGIEVGSLLLLLDSLSSAKDLLRSVNEGSKLYQALQREKYAVKFQEVSKDINDALNLVSYDKLDISEEVKEQIELVHTQFRRSKDKADSPDLQLLTDQSLGRIAKCSDPIILKRLSEKLQLTTINDLKQESLALREMVISNGGDPENCPMELSCVLKKINDCVLIETPKSENLETKESSVKYRSPVIPDDFRCPISLELMRDPVIVSTGQTYERSSIKKWLDSGHKTCPKTQQNLSHTALTPNFVLKSLISQWCEANGVDPPKKPGSFQDTRLHNHPECDRTTVNNLMAKLRRGNTEEQRAAAGEIRLLAKRNADNRVCMAEAGTVPLLINLLSSQDLRTQEHAVTALLNLSINDNNKVSIVSFGAIPGIVEVLKNGSTEARENAAATLFSLSVIDGNKIIIGEAGAVPALIDLLCQGSPRGKKDAATAILNLVIYQGNKVRAVRAGITGHLMKLLVDPSGGMVDEVLAILAILANFHEGQATIYECDGIKVLVVVMGSASQRNRERAAAVLWALLSTGDEEKVRVARELGAEAALKELAEGGTERAKRKAASLLEKMRQNVEA